MFWISLFGPENPVADSRCHPVFAPRYRDLLMDHRWRIPLPCGVISVFGRSDGWEAFIGGGTKNVWVVWVFFCQFCSKMLNLCFSDVRGFKPDFFEMPPRRQRFFRKFELLKNRTTWRWRELRNTKMFADLQFWRLQLKELFGISVTGFLAGKFGGKSTRFHYQPIGLFDFHCQPAGILLKKHIPYFT